MSFIYGLDGNYLLSFECLDTSDLTREGIVMKQSASITTYPYLTIGIFRHTFHYGSVRPVFNPASEIVVFEIPDLALSLKYDAVPDCSEKHVVIMKIYCAYRVEFFRERRIVYAFDISDFFRIQVHAEDAFSIGGYVQYPITFLYIEDYTVPEE